MFQDSDGAWTIGSCSCTFFQAAATALCRPYVCRTCRPSQVLYICLQTKMKAPHNVWDASDSLRDGRALFSSLKVNWTTMWAAKVLTGNRKHLVRNKRPISVCTACRSCNVHHKTLLSKSSTLKCCNATQIENFIYFRLITHMFMFLRLYFY